MRASHREVPVTCRVLRIETNMRSGEARTACPTGRTMFLARVTGSVIATQKLASMTGQKLFIVEPLRVDPKNRTELSSTQRSFVAVDTVGAGTGQLVLIVQGSSARMSPELEKLPIDTAIVGIVDEVTVEGKQVFKTN